MSDDPIRALTGGVPKPNASRYELPLPVWVELVERQVRRVADELHDLNSVGLPELRAALAGEGAAAQHEQLLAAIEAAADAVAEAFAQTIQAAIQSGLPAEAAAVEAERTRGPHQP